MNNPFSNRRCIDSSDYILKKKRLTKISHLKGTKYANYKTSSYIVCSNHVKKPEYRKNAYPEEPKFIPNPMLSYNEVEIHNLCLDQYGAFKCSSSSFDHYDRLSYESPSYNELYSSENHHGHHHGHHHAHGHHHVHPSDVENYDEKNSNFYNPKCKKCANDLASMKTPPKEWFCDGWDPPHSHCVGGNNIKLDETAEAYCCPNVKHCNWIICAKCYISLGKKNKVKYIEPPTEVDSIEYDPKARDIKKQIEKENELLLREKVESMRKTAPFLKCISSYAEYLDLAKGFHMTEPFCEETYPDICDNLNNGKLVQNISDGKYSAIDMGKSCIYKKEVMGESKKNMYGNHSLYRDVVVDKVRAEKGLLNLRATVVPKIKTERVFKFPLTLKKTHFCSEGVDKISQKPVIHDFAGRHIHWFPTRNAFVKYHHRGNKPFARFELKTGHQTVSIQNPQLQIDMSEEGKRRVLDFTGPRHGGRGFHSSCNCEKNQYGADHIFSYKIR